MDVTDFSLQFGCMSWLVNHQYTELETSTITTFLCLIFADAAVEFSWTKEEVADLNNTSIIIAADGKS